LFISFFFFKNGDAHIGKSGGNKGFITFEQTAKHKDYIMDIYRTLNEAG